MESMRSNLELSSLTLLCQQFIDPEMDLSTVESILVSLLDQGLIKGYIMHTRSTIVFSTKSNAFPEPYALSKAARG